MNMDHSVAALSAMDLIVGLALLFAAVFLAAWIASPKLRAWIERPKYRFQSNVRSYDEARIKSGSKN
jgi:hypothetical protein